MTCALSLHLTSLQVQHPYASPARAHSLLAHASIFKHADPTLTRTRTAKLSACRVVTSQTPAAEWMHAVLAAGKFMASLQSPSQEQELLSAYATHSFFSHALLYSLFRSWVQQTAAEMRPHLALPSPQELARFMEAATSTRCDWLVGRLVR